MFTNDVLFWNALSITFEPVIVVTLGKVTVTRFVHPLHIPLNALEPFIVTRLGKFSSVKPVQFLKQVDITLVPLAVVKLEKSTLVKAEHP
jgi:hypothetical protein